MAGPRQRGVLLHAGESWPLHELFTVHSLPYHVRTRMFGGAAAALIGHRAGLAAEEQQKPADCVADHEDEQGQLAGDGLPRRE